LIVAFLCALHGPIAARSSQTHHAFGWTEEPLFESTARITTIERIYVAIITSLEASDKTITTFGGHTRSSCHGAAPPRLPLAGITTAIACGGVTVIAGLAAFDMPVAANHDLHAILSFGGTSEGIFHIAAGTTAIAVYDVAVVASFAAGLLPISAKF